MHSGGNMGLYRTNIQCKYATLVKLKNQYNYIQPQIHQVTYIKTKLAIKQPKYTDLLKY
jgi:hypothetical protein